jgi:thiamine pyrophosphokinase
MKGLLLPDDDLIAADGGTLHLKRMNLIPRVLIGDLDSVEADEITRLDAAGVEIIRYPVEKDETDLELALLYALKYGYAQIMICAALGGRLDQTLGNLSLLAYPGTENRRVWLDDGMEAVYLIRREITLTGKPGDTLSLIPWYGPACGVTTRGLRYPLEYETLYPEHTRGISNEFVEDQISVSITGGILLCVHTRSS